MEAKASDGLCPVGKAVGKSAKVMKSFISIRIIIGGILLLFVGVGMAQGSASQNVAWQSPTNGVLLELNQPYPVRATTTSQLPIHYYVAHGPAVIADGMVTVTNVGSVVLVAEQAGNETFAPATASSTFNIGEVQLSKLGVWGGFQRGPARAVSVAENRAYVAMGTNGLAIFDVSEPANPQPLGSCALTNNNTVVQVAGNHAYLLGGNLKVVDVSDPANPKHLSTYRTPSTPLNLFVRGHYVYLALGFNGYEILDVSDPAKPVKIAGTPVLAGSINTSISDVWVEGDLLFLAGGSSGLFIYDISNQTTPLFLWRKTGVGTIRGMVAVGTKVFLACDQSGLQIVDVSNLAVPPVLVGGWDTPGRSFDVWVDGQIAYLSDDGVLRLLDISNPQSPAPLSSYTVKDLTYSAHAVDGMAYVADTAEGLVILDVSSPSVPIKVSGYNTSGITYDVDVAGTIAYAADGLAGLQILDFTDPNAPVLLGNYNTAGSAVGVKIVGDIAYVADSTNGLEVIQVADPTSPRRLGGFNTSGTALGVDVVGSLAYVADGSAGLQIFDVSNPTNVVRLGGLDTPGNAGSVQVVGNIAYIADGSGRVRVIDISVATNPQPHTVYRSSTVTSMEVVRDVLYTCESRSFRASRIPQIEYLGGYDSNTEFALDVEVVGSFALLGNSQSLVRLFDVSRPVPSGQHFPNLSSQQTYGPANALKAVGDRVYVASLNWGVEVLQLTETRIPQTLTFNVTNWLSVIQVDEPVDLTAVANTGLPIAYTIVSGPATITNNQLYATGLGRIVIRAEQVGTAQYAPVSVEQTITVIKQPQTITWQTPQVDQRLTIGQSYPLSAASSSGLPVTYRVESGPAVIVDGSVTATNYGAIMLVAEQAGNVTHASATSHRGFNRGQIQLEQLGEWPEIQNRPVRGVAVVGDIAYLITPKEGLISLDTSDPVNPIQIGQYLGVQNPTHIQVVGDIAWVADALIGLVAVDVSNPAAPALLASYSLSGGAVDLLVDGSYAYILNPAAGMHIVDISDVSQLLRVGGYDEEALAESISLVGGYIYLRNSLGKISIIDLSDVRNPAKVATYDALVARAIVDGNRAYMLGQSPGLRVVNITDPKAPTSVASYSGAGYGFQGQLVGSKLYMLATEGLKILDISNTSAPKLIGSLTVTNCTSFQVVGNLAYFASTRIGLQIADVSDPASPRKVWGFDETLSVGDLEVTEGLALLKNGASTIALLDITDPQAPFQLSSITNSGVVSDIELSGNLAYLSTGTNGLQVWDFSDPTNPVKVSSYMFAGSVGGVQIVGDRAYAHVNVTNVNTLEILSISNGTNLVSLGKLTERMSSFQVVDGFLFALTSEQGVRVFDVSDPAHPLNVSTLSYKGGQSMEIVDDLLYLVIANVSDTSAIGIRVIDISNPYLPREVRRHNTTQIRGGLQIKNHHAVCIDAWNSLLVWDLNNPNEIVLEANSLTNQQVVNIRIAGDVVHVANRVSGLTLLRLSEGKSNQVVTFEPPDSLRMTNSPLTLAASADSGLPVTFSVVSGPASIQGNQLILNRQGSVVVRAEQIGNEQYFRAFTDRVVDVVKAPQAIDWTSPIHNTLRLPNQKYPLRATSTSGLPVTFSVISGPATIQGRDVVLNDRGTVVMRAEQAGDNHFFHTRVERTFRVTGEPQTLTWNLPLTNTVLELNEPYPVSATASSGLPVTFRVAAGPAMVTNNTVVVTNVGTVRLVAEQVDDEVYEPIAITHTFNSSYVSFTPVGSWTNHFRLWVFDVKVVDDKAYLGMGPDGIIILDVSDISAPKQIGRHAMSGTTYSLDVVGGYAYVSDSLKLQIIDVHTPSTPFTVGSYSGGGSSGDVQVIGDTAYVVVPFGNVGSGLHILDVSNRANPKRIGYFETQKALRVNVIGNYAYLACMENGFQILDISNPTKPTRLVASTASNRNTYDVQKRDEFLYLSNYDTGLEIINVSDPFNPIKVRDYSVTGKTRRLHFSEELLYLAGEGYGVRVVNPNAPGAAPNFINSYNTYPDVHGMDIQGDIAYLACGGDGLRLVRIREGIKQQLEFEMPAEINISREDTYPLEAEVSTGRAITFSVVSGPASIVGDEIVFHDIGEVSVRAEQVGNQQYIPVSITRKIKAVRDPQTVTWHAPSTNEVLLLDHPYPLQATASSGLPVKFRVKRGPAFITNNAVIVTNTGRVELFAVQDGGVSHEPASTVAAFNPSSSFSVSKVGGWSMASGDLLMSIRVVDDRAYLACGNGGLVILDVSNPASPAMLGSRDTPGFANGVEVVGELAFLADGENGLVILDVSNPSAPVILSNLNILSNALKVRVQNGLAYVSAYESRGGGALAIVDVKDPEHPVQIGSYDAPVPFSVSGEDLQVRGDVVYLAAAANGLHLIDVSDPTNPLLKGDYLPPYGDVGPTWVRGVEVSGGYAYINAFGHGVKILDITDPETPLESGGSSLSEQVARVRIQGNRLYAMTAVNSFYIMDIGNFGTNLIRTINTPIAVAGIWDMEISGPFIYIVCKENGLQILRQHEELSQVISFNPASVLELAAGFQTLEATASSGLPVTFSVVSGPATMNGNQLTFSGVGAVVVRAQQPGTPQFLPASLTRNITVTGLPNVGPGLMAPQMTGDALTLQVNTLVGIKYTLQRKEQLGSGEWENVSTITGNGSVITFTNEIAELPQMFYRVIITP